MRVRSLGLLCVGLSVLTGCVSIEHKNLEVASQGAPKKDLGAAVLPEAHPGDRIYYTNGGREKITEVKGERTVWRRSRSSKTVRSSNFIMPTLAWSNSKYLGEQKSSDSAGDIWPLRSGKEAHFSTRIASTNKETGEVYNGIRYWDCEVEDSERISILAGNFDTYKVECVRTNDMGKFRQERVWYYAPAIGQTVLRLDRYSSSKRQPKRTEMMAYTPSMRTFGKEARKSYWRFFRKTMENRPSGKTRVWKDKRSGGAVSLTPLKTLQQSDGTFCRQYWVSVKDKRGSRQGAGIACRDERKLWRIPKGISEEEGVSFKTS
jgi:hypothetical protein